MYRRLLVLIATAAALLSGMTVPAHAAVATEAVFNDPVNDPAAIQNRIVQLIQGADPGSTIRVSMYYATDPTIPDALIAAKNAGRNVQVIFDKKMKGTAILASLAAALGTDTGQSSWALVCPDGRGCIGDRPLYGSVSLNHNKFFLFSRTGGTDNVVVQSSANLHTGRDGLKGWNSALVLAGNAGIYNAYTGYFNDLKAQRVNNNYYDTRTPVTSGAAKVHFYPRQESNGSPTDPAEDTITTVLDHVECHGNSEVGTVDGTHRTIVRVAMGIFSRTHLARKLLALDKAGCYVEVALNYNKDSDSEVSSMNELVKTTGAYNGINVRYYCTADPIWIHSKYLIIEGKYYGVPDRKIVWTGSHNWSWNSLRQADEALLQLEDDTIFDRFRSNYYAVRVGSGIRSAGNGTPARC
ncbi:phospholipase D-like domain-containing protein [Nonomuraea sp. NPDC052634]|uniref:phospholipase D-like domain-containing protein n=1 Tax=Nonomuraea sp. NPDC052634 TaxID=3155813 RepID=UPI00341ADEFB